MKPNRKIPALLVLGVALGFASGLRATSFNYVSEGSAGLLFNGTGDFTFLDNVLGGPGDGYTFRISDGTAAGYFGNITGTYTFGTVTQNGSLSTANVSGNGSFLISADALFSASLAWIEIYQLGGNGGLNSGATLNLTSINYSGTNADLLALRNAAGGSTSLNFNFNPPVSLTDLVSGQQTRFATFTGNISTVPFQTFSSGTVPDGGTSLIFLGVSLASLAIFTRKFLG